MKSESDEVTDFYNKKVANMNFNHTCLAVIQSDSALRKDENFHPQVFKALRKKVIRHINYNLSDFSSSDRSDEE